MSRDILWSIIVLALLAGCYIGPSDSKPSPAPPEPSVEDDWGFNRSVPKAMEGRRELALKLSAVMDEFADQIEHDGEQSEPRMISTTDIAILFDRIVEYGFKGNGAYTHDFSDVVTSALEQLEPDNEAIDLTDKERRNVVQLFQALAQSLREVR